MRVNACVYICAILALIIELFLLSEFYTKYPLLLNSIWMHVINLFTFVIIFLILVVTSARVFFKINLLKP